MAFLTSLYFAVAARTFASWALDGASCLGAPPAPAAAGPAMPHSAAVTTRARAAFLLGMRRLLPPPASPDNGGFPSPSMSGCPGTEFLDVSKSQSWRD